MSVEWWDAVIAGMQVVRNQALVRFDNTISLLKSLEYSGQAQPGAGFTYIFVLSNNQKLMPKNAAQNK